MNNILNKPLHEIEQAFRIMAGIDIVMGKDTWSRCYSFKPIKLSKSRVAQYDNGSGDNLIVIFIGADEAIIKGFDHESPLSPYVKETFDVWPGIYDSTPEHLLNYIQNPNYEFDHVTFCYWKEKSLDWQKGNVIIPDSYNDGSDYLLNCINTNPESHTQYLNAYYGIEIDQKILDELYSSDIWQVETLKQLNPRIKVSSCKNELHQINLTLLS